MARYTGWRLLSGDTAARPDLLDIGKKLLADLDNQRRVSGIKTVCRRFTAVDGSIVTAKFDGDIPSIDIQSAAPAQASGSAERFRGFVTAPRMFGTAAASDGELAFGANAQVILAGKDGDSVTWRSGFFDGTYIPTGYAEPSFTYKRAFNDGLALAGNIDWTNTDASLALTWLGPKMRSLSLASVTWAATNTTHRGSCVYCNGAILVDHSLINADEKIIGACIARFTSGKHLVYVAYQHDKFGNVGNVPKVYAARLQVNGAQLATVAAEDVALLATGSAYGTTEHKLFPCFFFNQSGTEGRMIRCFVDGDTSGFTLHFTETVVTLAADGTATITEIDHGEALPVVTGSKTLTVGPNASNLAEMTFVDDNVPGGTVPVGTYDATYTKTYATGRAIVDDNPDNTPEVVANAGSFAYTMSVTGGPFPIAVDYQDDVAVYLYWTPAEVTHDASIDASWTQTTDATQSQSVTYADDPGAPGATYQSADEGAHHLEVAADGLLDASATDSLTGGRLHADDKVGTTWLDLAYSREATESAVGSASLSQAWDRSFTDTYDTDGTPLTSTDDRSASTTFSSTLARDHVVAEQWPMLWWLDLRSRSAAYSLYTRTTHDTSTVDVSADASTTSPGVDPEFPDAALTTDTAITEASLTLAIDTRMLFDGTQVEAVTASWADDAPTSSSVTGTAQALGVGDVLGFRFTVAAASNLDVTDALPALLPDGFWGSTDLSAVVAGFSLAGGASPSDLTQTDDLPAIALPTLTVHYSNLRFQPTSTTIDQPQSFVYVEPFATGSVYWIAAAADKESTAVPMDAGHVNFGTWISHGGLWAYAMPDLSDLTHADLSTPQYRFGVKGGASLDTLTGSHSAELFAFFWPLTPYLYQPPR